MQRTITQNLRQIYKPAPDHCPHCGSLDARCFSDDQGRWQLRCGCGASGPYRVTAAAALDAWNTRAEVATPSLVRWASGVER